MGDVPKLGSGETRLTTPLPLGPHRPAAGNYRPTSILHDERRFVLLHIPKTGGISLIRLLQSLFSEQQTLWLGGNWLGQLPKRLLRQTKYYFGHFTAEALDFVDDPKVTATLLRDPVDRFLSTYFYFRSQPQDTPNVGPTVRITRMLTIRDMLEPENLHLLKAMANVASSALARPLEQGHAWIDDPRTVTRACQGLDHLDYVGITEALEQSAEELL